MEEGKLERALVEGLEKALSHYEELKAVCLRQREFLGGERIEGLEGLLKEKEALVEAISQGSAALVPLWERLRDKGEEGRRHERVGDLLAELSRRLEEIKALEEESGELLKEKGASLKRSLRHLLRSGRVIKGYAPSHPKRPRFIDRRG